ncbi:MAG TPA: HNH endonuclease [Candidatus Paceibacterota bacterium]
METKVCDHCKEELTLDKFGVDNSKKDGIRTTCKECRSIQGKNRCIINRNDMSEEGKIHREIRQIKQAIRGKKYRDECQSEIIAYHEIYVVENKEKMSKYKKEYKKANATKIKISNRIYYKEHKVEQAEYSIKWKKENKVKVNLTTNRRRARKRLLSSDFTKTQWDEVKLYFNNSCAYCGEKLPLEQEHFIALNKGGGFTVSNMICACKSCNCSKSDNDFSNWYPTYELYSEERELIILDYINSKNTEQTAI